MTFVYILLSLLVLTFLIFFHELGHFTVGKLLGFRILGFSIGFGPAVFKFKKGETEYALRAHLRWAKGEYDEALKTCEEGLEISNGDAEIYRQQAIVYLLKGDYKKAAESANSSYQFAYYNRALDLRILNTAALCAGLAKDDDLYDSVEQTLQSYGYDVSTRVTDCLAGKLTVKEVFTEAGGSEI